MPRKATGNPPGRPKLANPFVEKPKRRNGRPTEDRAGIGRSRSRMEAWWTAAAHIEAELRIAGEWRLRSLKLLAADFAKPPAAVTKMRRDTRYLDLVEQLVSAARRPMRPLPDAEERSAAIRATLEAAYDKRMEIERLAALPRSEYPAARVEAAKRLRITRSALDAAVKTARAEANPPAKGRV